MRGSILGLMPTHAAGVELVPWMRAGRWALLLTGALVSFEAGCFSSSGNGGEPDAGISDSGNDGSSAECGDGGKWRLRRWGVRLP